MGMKLNTKVHVSEQTYRDLLTQDMEAQLHGYFWGRADEARFRGDSTMSTARLAQDWREWSSAKWEAWVDSYGADGAADTVSSTFFLDIKELFERWYSNRT
jgi:hypothetical protein